VHSLRQPSPGKPFVAVNCGAIPAALVESEFFGHKKGAFTGATGDHKGYLEEASGAPCCSTRWANCLFPPR